MEKRTKAFGVSAAVGLLLAPATLRARSSSLKVPSVQTSATVVTTVMRTSTTARSTTTATTVPADTLPPTTLPPTTLPATTLPPTTLPPTTVPPTTVPPTTVPPCGVALHWTGSSRLAVGAATVFNTGVVVPAGTFRITIRTYDSYETRATAVEPYEQVFALIGGAATANTTDLTDGTVAASATSDVGLVTTQGGELLVLHATERIGPTFEANGVSVVGIDVTPTC